MNEHDIPKETPENKDSNNTDEDKALRPEELQIFHEIDQNYESTPGSLEECFKNLDTYKANFLTNITKITTDTIAQPEALEEILTGAGHELKAYMAAIEQLPENLVNEGFNEEAMCAVVVEQYLIFNKSTIDALSVRVANQQILSYTSHEEAAETVETIFQHSIQAKESIDTEDSQLKIFGNLLIQSFINDINSDINLYANDLYRQNNLQEQKDNEAKIDFVVSAIEILMEEQEERDLANTRKSKLGRHALDMLKIAGGSAIGFMIARKFSR